MNIQPLRSEPILVPVIHQTMNDSQGLSTVACKSHGASDAILNDLASLEQDQQKAGTSRKMYHKVTREPTLT